MKLHQFLEIVGDEPVLRSSLLRAGDVSEARIELQLARWVAAGKLIRLRRGLYVPARPYRKVEPHAFHLANSVTRSSYVSLQSALAYYGLIPEHVPVVTSVTTGRPERVRTPLGVFASRHVGGPCFFGYQRIRVTDAQEAYVAMPEKALLDIVYLTPGGDAPDFLRELRLQNVRILDRERLAAFTKRIGKPKLERALRTVIELMKTDGEYEEL